MITRKKVVPPLTPRIVQANPRQRITRYLLLFFAFLLTAWFSYDHGRSQTQVPVSSDTRIARPAELEHRIAELEQERDTLKQQVAELERSVKQVNKAFDAAQNRIQTLQQEQSAPSGVAASLPQPVAVQDSVSVVSESTDNTLKLENLRIESTDSENVFRIGFSVMHDGDSSGRVTGTIWIAVNGISHKQPKRLSFKTLSPDRRSYVKMGFDLQQDVMEDVVLPEGFRPKNVQIEAKPYGDKYTGTSQKISWAMVE